MPSRELKNPMIIVEIRDYPAPTRHNPSLGTMPHQCDAAQPCLRLPHLFREMEDRPHQRLHLRSFLGEGMVGRRREDTQGDRF